MRTRKSTGRNLLLDLLVTTVSILIALAIVRHFQKDEIVSSKLTQRKADIKFLMTETEIVQNTFEKTMENLNRKVLLANELNKSLTEKNYRYTDSLATVVFQFDPNTLFNPELLGFEAFLMGNEIKRLSPLNTRKELLKNVKHLKEIKQAYQQYQTSVKESYNALVDKQFNLSSGELKSGYYLYNGDWVNWLTEYEEQSLKMLQLFKNCFHEISAFHTTLQKVLPKTDDDIDEKNTEESTSD